MEYEVMKYFQNARVPDAQKCLTRSAGMRLCRGKVSTMAELCDLCEQSPEKLLEIRDIGEKTAALILEVCATYKAEKQGRNEHEHE